MPSHDRLLQSRFTRRQALLALAAAAATPALASSFPRSALAQDQVTLTLVAYSTPREAYEEIIPLFQATPEGANVVIRDLVRGLGRAEPRRRERPPGRHRGPLARTGHHPPHRAGSGRRGLERRRVQRDGDRLRRRLRRPARQSEGHRHLGRSARGGRRGASPRTRSPRAAPAGTSWPPGAPSSSRARREEEAIEYLRQLFTHVPVQDKSAREVAGHLRRRQGRRPARLRERGRSPRSRRARSSSTSIPDQTILIENPVAVVTESANPGEGGRSSSPSCARRRRSASSARRATARSCPRSWPSSTLPDARRSSSPSPISAAGPR